MVTGGQWDGILMPGCQDEGKGKMSAARGNPRHKIKRKARNKVCLADSRRHLHWMLIGRRPPAEEAAAQVLRQARRKPIPKSNIRQNKRGATIESHTSTMSGGLAAQRVIMDATRLHNAAIHNSFLASMLKNDGLRGAASARYVRRHLRAKSSELAEQTQATTLQAEVQVIVEKYDDAFDFEDSGVSSSKSNNRDSGPLMASRPADAESSHVDANRRQLSEENVEALDWDVDEDSDSMNPSSSAINDGRKVLQTTEFNGNEASNNISNIEDLETYEDDDVKGTTEHDEIAEGKEDKEDGEGHDDEEDNDFVLTSDAGPVMLQMTPSPGKLKIKAAGARGHIPFQMPESGGLAGFADATKLSLPSTSGTSGMVFNKELMRWEPSAENADEEDEFMAGFSSGSGFSSSDSD